MMGDSNEAVKDGVVILFVTTIVVLLVLLLLVVGYAAGESGGVEKTRREAIEVGVGFWEVHPKTGERMFVWRRWVKE